MLDDFFYISIHDARFFGAKKNDKNDRNPEGLRSEGLAKLVQKFNRANQRNPANQLRYIMKPYLNNACRYIYHFN